MNERLSDESTEQPEDSSEVVRGLARSARFAAEGPDAIKIYVSAETAEKIKAKNNGELPENIYIKEK